ncbi:MAG: hypothetical protein M1837_000603 [Sclerophora amabilis]|nr:MAG: hypothetical protein M1837_000603 [Sclerophora amabilis]
MASVDPDGIKRRRVDSWSGAPPLLHQIPYAPEPPAQYPNHSLPPPPPQQPSHYEPEHRGMELPPPSPVHHFSGHPRYGPPPPSSSNGPFQSDHPPPPPPPPPLPSEHNHINNNNNNNNNNTPVIKTRSPVNVHHPTLRPLNVQNLNNGHPPLHHTLDSHSAGPSYHDGGHHTNGTPHPGHPMASPSEVAATHGRSYLTSPVSGGPVSGGGGGGSGGRDYSYAPSFVTTYPAKRKAVRAVQACDACRTRKAKCDEGRPSCGFCKDAAIQCVYRDVPPPKQDRTLLQILEEIRIMKSQLPDFREVRDQHRRLNARLRYLEGQGPPPPSAERSLSRTADDMHQDEDMDSPASHPLERKLLSRGRSSSDETAPQQENLPQAEAPPRSGQIIMTDDGQGELAIPIEHTTAAHKLLRWPSIRALVTPITNNENYVMQVEEKRGLLRVWGRGEGQDLGDSVGRPGGWTGEGGSPPEGDDLPYGSPAPPFPGGTWGTGLVNPIPSDARKPAGENVGGLNADGSLKLDNPTLRYLLDSYLRNIHILHPFLDADRITNMVRAFGAKHSAPYPANGPRSPFIASSNTPNADSRRDSLPSLNRGGPKRKWSNANLAGPHSPGTWNASPSTWNASSLRTPPDRSISSALILLVLALGKVCENANWVPGPVPEPTKVPCTTSGSPVYQTDSPPISIKHSPSSSHSSVTTSAASPHNDLGRIPPPAYPISPAAEKAAPKIRNIDVIPGLAYFAYATDILGNLHGGSDLSHVQAGLLAGLYAGQLGRVLESWSWINWACTKCQILVHPQRFDREGDASRKDLIIVAFWTCLQLESDILAELDLPPSGISRLEEKITLPMGQSNLESEIWMYYYAQISLRRLLNRVHSAYHYKPEHKSANRTRFATKELEELQFQLSQWREALPERLRWKDSDPPPSEINAARLRAKYYGARYIIHRPFLHHVMHPIEPASNVPKVHEGQGEGAAAGQADDSPGVHDPAAVAYSAVAPLGPRPLDKGMVQACRNCIEAAIQSTEAFHGIKGRPIVTNIFGTAHAQFGNLLVLQAAARSPLLSQLVPSDHLNNLLHRTVQFLRNLQDISPTLKCDATILESSIMRNSCPPPPPAQLNSSFSSIDGT